MAIKNELTVKTTDGNMRVCVMDITPKKAQEFLCLNTNNRILRRSRIDLYTREMNSGNWKENGLPIVIGDDNELKDGQHRLHACIKSGKTLKNTLVVYLPQKQANCFDIGATRNTRDIAMLSGITDIPSFRSFNVHSGVNCALYGIRANRTYSKLEMISEMQQHKEACEFIFYRLIIKSHAQNTKLIKSSVSGAVYNAYLNGYDLDKLENFCNVYASGISKSDEDVAIIKLRDQVITSKDNSKDARYELYMKAQLALHCYENNEVITSLGKNKIEFYPHPSKKTESEEGQLTLE